MTPVTQDLILDCYAIKALQSGTATSEQQIRFWNWLLYVSCDINGSTQKPTDRETSFYNGKREVGLDFVRMVEINAEELKKKLSKSINPETLTATVAVKQTKPTRRK